MILLTQRLKMPGILDTMSDQAPALRAAMAKIMEDLPSRIAALDGDGWEVRSHSMTIHSGLMIATFLVER